MINEEILPLLKVIIILLVFLILVLYIRNHNKKIHCLRESIPDKMRLLLKRRQSANTEVLVKIKEMYRFIKHLSLSELIELDRLISKSIEEIHEEEKNLLAKAPKNKFSKLTELDLKVGTFQQIHGADILSFIINPEDRDIWREFSIDNFSMIDEYHRIIDAATARASTLESLNSRHFGDHSRTVATK